MLLFHGLVGDDRPANCLDRPGRLHPRGISADDHRKSRGIGAIGDGDDDRARNEGGAGAVAPACCGECAAAATEDLSRQLVMYPLLDRGWAVLDRASAVTVAALAASPTRVWIYPCPGRPKGGTLPRSTSDRGRA